MMLSEGNVDHENVDFNRNSACSVYSKYGMIVGKATKMRLLSEYLKVRSVHFIIPCSISGTVGSAEHPPDSDSDSDSVAYQYPR